MLYRLKKLQSEKGQFDNLSELSFFIKKNAYIRTEIQALTQFFLHRDVKGCNDCFCDAYLQLISLKEKQIMSTIELKFRLFAGVLLQKGNKFVSNANLTNENAMFFLKDNPENIKKFQKVPENLQDLLNPTPQIEIKTVENAVVSTEKAIFVKKKRK